jgi:hypothetical protein
MLLTDGFMIHLIIIIVSIILSYLLYKYLNNDLIDISKFVKNDIEKFTNFNTDIFNDETAHPTLVDDTKDITNFNADIFNDETAYPTLDDDTKDITNKKDEFLILEKEKKEELNRLQKYVRK